MTFKGLSLRSLKVKWIKPICIIMLQKYLLSNRLDIDLSKNKAIVKRYLAAEFARQLYGESNYEIIFKRRRVIRC
jgi:carboxyl-terminal processing protease